jgi:endonuclease YncB( thermonuclease family)
MLVYGRDVTLRTHAHYRYDRTVAMVFIEGSDVGLQLLRQGLAWPHYHYLSEATPEVQTSYLAAAEAARAARIGLWRDSEPMAPWLFRHSHVLTIHY